MCSSDLATAQKWRAASSRPLWVVGDGPRLLTPENPGDKPTLSGFMLGEETLAGIESLLVSLDSGALKLDVDGELIKARAWCDTNRRVCTKRFFVNWLNRAMDRVAPIAGAQSPSSASVTPVERVQMNTELERCIDQMRVIKATYGDHQTWTQQDIAKYKMLRTRRDELKAKLGVVV